MNIPLRKCKYCGVEANTIEELALFCTNSSYMYNKMLECKPCKNKRFKDEYYKDIEKSRLYYRTRAQGSGFKLRALAYKGNKCLDCMLEVNQDNYVIFDFHHLIPSEKEFTPSNILNHSWKKLTKELDKCVLLCSNCHRLRHHNEKLVV